jgi:hypothetical protein
MDFKASKKKLKVSVGEQVYELACLSILEHEQLEEGLKGIEPGKAMQFYAEVMAKHGLPKEVFFSEFDSESALDLITLWLSPKKKN